MSGFGNKGVHGPVRQGQLAAHAHEIADGPPLHPQPRLAIQQLRHRGIGRGPVMHSQRAFQILDQGHPHWSSHPSTRVAGLKRPPYFVPLKGTDRGSREDEPTPPLIAEIEKTRLA